MMLPASCSQKGNSGPGVAPRSLRRPPTCSPRAVAQLQNPAAVSLTASVVGPAASFSSLGALLGLAAAPWAVQRLIRRLFGRRGKRRPAMPAAQVRQRRGRGCVGVRPLRLLQQGSPSQPAAPHLQADTRATFSVATFNLRGVMDRWQERQPLLRQCLQQMDADVLCFQECLTGACCSSVKAWLQGQCRGLAAAWV